MDDKQRIKELEQSNSELSGRLSKIEKEQAQINRRAKAASWDAYVAKSDAERAARMSRDTSLFIPGIF